MKGLIRAGESVEDAARRNAINAVYNARNAGLTMHDAGELAAQVVLATVRADERRRGVDKGG